VSGIMVELVYNKKICTSCGELKDINEYYFLKNRKRRHKYTQRCKECTSVFNKEQRKKHKKPCPMCGKLILKASSLCSKCVVNHPNRIKATNKLVAFQKLRKMHVYCIDCGIEIGLRGKRCVRCKNKGERNSQWKGGVTILKERLRDSFEYRQWRSDVFTRDRFTCTTCGHTGSGLQAHHIIPFSVLMQKYEITIIEQAIQCDELWNINNGLTLCRDCHIVFHTKEVDSE